MPSAPLGAVGTRGQGLPGVGPSLPYPVKAALTLGRSTAWLARTRGRPDTSTSGLRILLYHRVADDHDALALSPHRFREQMEHLAAEGYRVVDLIEALGLLQAGPLPPRTIGLTFDDGFADLAEHALPVLAEHGFHATVFVTTGVTDGRLTFPWYEHQPRVLGWDEVVDLDRAGTFRFEAHTVSHPSLLAVDDATAETEIRESKLELEGRLGRPVTAFAYPAGLFGDRECRLVADAGYSAAVSCEPGVNGPSCDRFALRRRQIDSRDRLLDFKAKIGGGHDTPLPLRATYRRLRYGSPTRTPRRVSSRA
jgi:peptidoglycan/xylan/chitin deacetylase (PgdA/CDA1 family)